MKKNSGIELSRISHVNLYSKDNRRLLKFYRDTIGLQPLPDSSEDDDWYGFATKGVTFAIEPGAGRAEIPFRFNRKNPVLIQFKANSKSHLERINKQLEKKGIRLLRRSVQRSYGIITNFLDPDGNLMEVLYEEG